MQTLQRTVLWRMLFQPGAEYFSLSQNDDRWQLAGTVVLAHDGKPLMVQYQVVCDLSWYTRMVNAELSMGTVARRLHLAVDEQQRWWSQSDEWAQLRGCADVDLSVTPSTNTLPIRRLSLEVGSSAQLIAAWVRFPELSIEPLSQTYTRLAEDRYRYESGNGSFVAEIEVDEWGLVKRYERGWEREAVIGTA